MKQFITIVFACCCLHTFAQKTILINNVQIFNGSDEKINTGNILIVNNLISKISSSPIPTVKSANVQIIDGKENF